MRKSPVLKVQVLDVDNDSGAEYRDIEVEVEDWGIVVRPIGYGNNTSEKGRGCPLFIEFRNGVPMVIIWDDINNEEASHIISLESAAESGRCTP